VIERPDFLTKESLDSPNHSEERVVRAIISVVPGTDEAHASNCYYTAKSLGMAIVTTALLEIAEFYAQQMYRMGCRTSIEPDRTVV
jgi:ATP-dependent Clp protease adapter protein ClpS